jgi:hypothetical protein
MPAFKKWKDKVVPVTSLQLDPKNPRIPELGKSPSQRDIAAELIRHDRAYELARDIAEQGYFPTEVLIAIKEAGVTTVIEGNRRLTAVKCLLSPSFAPEEYVKRFTLLAQKANTAALRRIRISIAPSRDVAVPVILARHTATGIVSWEPSQQAKFIASLISSDMSVDEVATQYGIARSDVIDALKVHTMYKIASTLDLPDDILRTVRDPRQFSISTLERLIKNPQVPAFLGIKFDESGSLSGSVKPEEFKKGYSRIVADIAAGRASSRTLNTAKQIADYLAEFGSDVPDSTKRGTFEATDLLGKGNAPAKPKPKPRLKKKRKTSKSIFPPGFRSQLTSPKINDIFDELKKMRVDDFQNSVGVMLRIFVELAVSNYLEKTGKMKPLLDEANKKKRPVDWTPTLRQMLRHLLADSEIQGQISRSALKALNRCVSSDTHPMSLDSLDQFVHNRLIAPDARDLRHFWAQFEELLTLLVLEPLPLTTEDEE